MFARDIVIARWDRLRNKSTGIHFESPNLQDSCSITLFRMVLHMGHIGQDLHAR